MAKAKLQPIIRNVFDDYGPKKAYPKTYPVYEQFLYREVKLGAMPLIKIKCADKEKLLKYSNRLQAEYGVVSITGPTWYNVSDASPYNDVIAVNQETGELII